MFDGSTAIVDVTNGSTGETWMDRNLGASRAATSSLDAAAYGDLYQWGRCPDGHESKTSSTTSTNATTAVPNLGNSWDGKFMTEVSTTPYDWLIIQDNTLWQGVSGTNNPCPNGYRLPTEAELDAERLSWVQPPISSTNDYNGAFASPLKLPGCGYRSPSGTFLSEGYGYYRNSTISGGHAGWLYFYNTGTAGMTTSYRVYGMSVRCIKD